ncbi:hypothetical protein MNBD_GAMMA15-2087 [hydrothermal vent metagenome]|uniref:Uncharacterized protein n=1 Tax=hydrothermal vent metagenome TaxID=652676 RepID=A0A3B0Z1F7_9ZZZZ
MIKQKFTGFILTAFILFLPAMVNAQFGNEVKLLASDGATGDVFGLSVSISGDAAVTGARWHDDNGSNSGSAYMFVRNPVTGIWTEQQKLLASDGVANDNFGSSVSISGDTAIIGAPLHDDNGTSSGSAYVFVRDSVTGIWSQQAELLASDGTSSDQFGISVSISGDTAIVGAFGEGSAASRTGAAYIFVRDPATGAWSQQAKLLASDGAATDQFGESVSISGDTVIAGAIAHDDNGIDSGAAYIFVRNPITGIWTEQQKLLASDGALNDNFGFSVSISGDTVIAGAFAHDDNAFNSGSIYIFVRNPATGIWLEQQKLQASDGAADDELGWSVSISGDTAIAGARLHDDNGSNSGSAYVFVRNPVTGAWSQQTELLASDGVAGDDLGRSVSIDGNTVVAGAIGQDGNSNDSGSIYIYTSSGTTAPDITVTDSVASTTDLQVPFGDITELTTAADQTVTVSNDGNADLILGNIAVANALAAPFSILNDTCSAQTLAPAANCSLTVRFSPGSIGNFSDSFDIPSDDPDENPVTVSISGNGVGVPVPDITVTDTLAPANDLQIAFADLTVGGSNDQTVTVVNDGNADLVIGTVAQANALAAPFSVLNDICSGQTLVATASCTLDVRFAPTTAVTSNDSFDIPSNDPDENPVTVSISGTGLAGVNNPPSVPNLVSPADGQTGLPTTLDLVWEPSTDPDGDTVSYDVYHCADTDPVTNCLPLVALNTSPNSGSGNGLFYAGLGLGGGIMILGITLPGGVRSRKQTVLLVATLVIITLLSSCKSHNNGGNGGGVANQSFAIAGSNAATTYYWAVVAKDGNGGTTPSAVWSYTTQ